MDHHLNYAPCGFLSLSKEGIILSINQTLLNILGYHSDQLVGEHINSILSNSARAFFQLYFIPLITKEKQVEEMYLSLSAKNIEDIPVLINASFEKINKNQVILCIIVPMRKRNEYENQLLIAKKIAETAKSKLETALESLEDKQEELLVIYKKNQKYKVETEKELELAKKIQETSLPEVIKNEDIQIESYYKASHQLSGDIYGLYEISNRQYGIILLDVMGHGISSALITMSLQSLSQRLISKGASATTIMQELDQHLHNLFHNNEEAWHYCTAIYLFIDTEQQTIEYINAGHPPAIYQDISGAQQELPSTTLPLGTIEGIPFKPRKLSYQQGGRILVYTDGVSEPIGPDGLSNLMATNSTASLLTCKENILQSLKNKKSIKYQTDDQCFILVDL